MTFDSKWISLALLGSALAIAGCSDDPSVGGAGGMGGAPGATVSVSGTA